jgi:hypothetical protein
MLLLLLQGRSVAIFCRCRCYAVDNTCTTRQHSTIGMSIYNEYKVDTHHYLMFLLIYHFLASNSKRAFFDIITQSEYYYYSKNRIVLIK